MGKRINDKGGPPSSSYFKGNLVGNYQSNVGGQKFSIAKALVSSLLAHLEGVLQKKQVKKSNSMKVKEKGILLVLGYDIKFDEIIDMIDMVLVGRVWGGIKQLLTLRSGFKRYGVEF